MIKTSEQGGQEEAIKEFQEQKSEKLDIMAPKTMSAWIDLYNGLAGKDVYQKAYYKGRSGFFDEPLSFDEFREIIDEQGKTLYSEDAGLLGKVNLLVKELGGVKISASERENQRSFEETFKRKPEINPLKPKSGEEWKDFYNVLAGRKLLKKLNYYDDEEAARKLLTFEEFRDIVTQTIPIKKDKDIDLAGKIDQLLERLGKR